MKAPTVAVIGGTGMNQWPGLVVSGSHALDTPWGAPSAPLVIGAIGGRPVAFLARHGEGHKIPPHRINYRANIAGLHATGIRTVIAIAAVGGISEWFAPGEVALPSDVVDYTYGREHTYTDGTEGAPFQHVELGAPYTPRVRAVLLDAARNAGVTVAGAGVMGVTQGPRLETPAEIRRMRVDGCDMVGMTGMPEAALAAELGLEYACLALSVNWAAGLGTGGIHAEIERSIAAGMAKVQAILAKALESL
jgi:5'-deoxy-5'-methylthioadenosine phosphorylase